jgi:hypothetical protein
MDSRRCVMDYLLPIGLLVVLVAIGVMFFVRQSRSK